MLWLGHMPKHWKHSLPQDLSWVNFPLTGYLITERSMTSFVSGNMSFSVLQGNSGQCLWFCLQIFCTSNFAPCTNLRHLGPLLTMNYRVYSSLGSMAISSSDKCSTYEKQVYSLGLKASKLQPDLQTCSKSLLLYILKQNAKWVSEVDQLLLSLWNYWYWISQ